MNDKSQRTCIEILYPWIRKYVCAIMSEFVLMDDYTRPHGFRIVKLIWCQSKSSEMKSSVYFHRPKLKKLCLVSGESFNLPTNLSAYYPRTPTYYHTNMANTAMRFLSTWIVVTKLETVQNVTFLIKGYLTFTTMVKRFSILLLFLMGK